MGQASVPASTVDRNGTPVAVGTVVRVLSISASVLDRLDEDERQRVQSMLGQAFAVYEVDQWGSAWVERWWKESENSAISHSLALKSAEMEAVPKANV